MAIKRFPNFTLPISNEQLENEIDEAMGGRDAQTVNEVADLRVMEFAPGTIVTGKIVRKNDSDVFIDIGYKSEGCVPLQEFREDESIEPGTELKVFLEAVEDENGLVQLSKRKADRIAAWQRIMENFKVGDIIKGRAIRKIKGGLLVDIGVPVFLPASQVDIRRTSDVSDWIGRELECVIIKIDEDRRNIVLSRRKRLEEERDQMKHDLLQSIEVGEVRRGVVKNITDFGAFIDLGGIDGLLHITDISWGRINHPSEIVQNDQTIEVMVLSFDKERERISLGLKQLQSNPWTQVPDKYPIGSRHTGEVVNIVPYGAFVKLEDGIEGLVHVSEMSWTKQIQHPTEVVKIGDMVDVVVLDENTEKQEISLGIKQTEENPWEKLKEKYPAGTIIEGKVRNLTSFGAFIEIEEGIDGLLHVSDISWTKKVSHPSQTLKKNETVKAVVLSVDPERKRVALGMKQLVDDPWVYTIPAKFAPGDMVKGKVTKLTSFGAFVEISDSLEGLLHISEMSDQKIEKPEEILKVGDEIDVRIINVDPEDRKIGLSLRDPDSESKEVGEMETDNRGKRVDIRQYIHDDKKQVGSTLGAALQSALREAVERREETDDDSGDSGDVTGDVSENESGDEPDAQPEPEEKPADETADAADDTVSESSGDADAQPESEDEPVVEESSADETAGAADEQTDAGATADQPDAPDESDPADETASKSDES